MSGGDEGGDGGARDRRREREDTSTESNSARRRSRGGRFVKEPQNCEVLAGREGLRTSCGTRQLDLDHTLDL